MYKILIVDDESLERKALRTIIKENIPSITEFAEASDGQDGLERAREFRPDLMIMDIKMPRLNGIEASRLIKAEFPHCQIILLSGFTYFSYAREAVSIGISDFLVKPIDDDDLIDSVQNVIDRLEREKEKTVSDPGDAGQMKALYNYVEEEFVSSLISHQLREPQLSRFKETLDIGDEHFLGVILKDSEPSEAGGERERRIREAANTVFERDRIISVFQDNQTCLLLMLKEYRANLILKKQFKEFLKLIEGKVTPLPAVHAGSIKKEASQISESFNEARMVPLTQESVAFYQPPLSPRDLQFPINEEDELCESLIRGDLEMALTLACNLFLWIDGNSKNFSEFRLRIYELLVLINRRARRELDPGDSTLYFQKVNAISTKDEIKDYLLQTIRDLNERIKRHYSTSAKVWKKQITEYISQNFRQTIGLDELAEIAGFSAPYLSRIFKKEFGMSFTSYVNHLRIKSAKAMLADSGKSIKEISYELGFSDSNYFARVFKKETGINASQYKKTPGMGD
ncbi:MAG: response regulator [Spirochaetales bacterium]|nr:response regulator [Spirochaetales bacterium]